MPNFDNFDINQMFSKLAQRWRFVYDFYQKKFQVILIMLKMPKDNFFGTPIINQKLYMIIKIDVLDVAIIDQIYLAKDIGLVLSIYPLVFVDASLP